MSGNSPIRNPDLSSPDMMTKRAWWLVIFNFILPGSAQALAGNRRLGKFGLAATLIAWALVILALIVSVLWPQVLLFLGTWGPSLFIFQIALIFYAVLWCILTFDTLRLVRIIKTKTMARIWIILVTVLGLVVSAGTAAYSSSLVGGLNNALGQIFVAGPSVPPVDGQYNFLLLGGDSGPDRQGMRPDTAQVVSVNATTGAATIIGMPRDLQSIPFAADSPLWSVYPEGYTQTSGEYCDRWACLNTLYVAAELDHPDLYPDAVTQGSSPGIEAMKDAAEGITGLQIQYYVLIDMQGLSDLIDALGGVTVEATERIAIAEPETPEDQVPEWIEPGVQQMDGYHALMYARSRWNGMGDYDRMARQQQIQEAMLQQMNPANVLTKFQAIAAAGTEVVKTDIPQSMLSYFVELGVKSKEQPLTKIELTPAFEPFPVDTEYPDYASIQAYIYSVIHPPTPTATPSG